MHRMISLIASYLKRLPDHRRNRIFELALLRLPLWLIKRIPCSYSTYLACYTPGKGDVIIDCGAHIGNCALLFSRLVGKEGLVVAAEPLEKAFHILQERVHRLGLRTSWPSTKGYGTSPHSRPSGFPRVPCPTGCCRGKRQRATQSPPIRWIA